VCHVSTCGGAGKNVPRWTGAPDLSSFFCHHVPHSSSRHYRLCCLFPHLTPHTSHPVAEPSRRSPYLVSIFLLSLYLTSTLAAHPVAPHQRRTEWPYHLHNPPIPLPQSQSDKFFFFFLSFFPLVTNQGRTTAAPTTAADPSPHTGHTHSRAATSLHRPCQPHITLVAHVQLPPPRRRHPDTSGGDDNTTTSHPTTTSAT
jgi:hypothetical protein